MSKSEEFRLRILNKEDNHAFRRRKAQQQRELNEQDAKEQLRHFGRGDDDPELGSSVHKDK